jgi:hypothetical protein
MVVRFARVAPLGRGRERVASVCSPRAFGSKVTKNTVALALPPLGLFLSSHFAARSSGNFAARR